MRTATEVLQREAAGDDGGAEIGLVDGIQVSRERRLGTAAAGRRRARLPRLRRGRRPRRTPSSWPQGFLDVVHEVIAKHSD